MKRSLALSLILTLVLPALVAVVLMWSVVDRTENLAQVPAAVVNADTMVTGPDGQPLYGGRLVASELVAPSQERSVTFVLTNADDAAAGLASGAYVAVVTIPSDFSAKLATVSTPSPQVAQLTVESNDASAPVLGPLAAQLGAAATQAISQQVTTRFVGGMLDGMTTLSASLTAAATGAATLASGTSQYTAGVSASAQGAGQLAAGLGQAASGAVKLTTGVSELASGSSQLSQGAAQSAAGAGDLAAGAGNLATGAGDLATGAGDLAATMPELTLGAAGLATGVKQLNGGIGPLASGAKAAAAGAGDLATGLQASAAGAQALFAGLQTLGAGLGQLQAATQDLPVQATALHTGAQQAADAAKKLADGLAAGGANPVLADFLAAVGAACAANPQPHCAQLPGVQQSLQDQAKQLQEAAAGAQQVAAGTAKLAKGTQELVGSPSAGGLVALSASIKDLATRFTTGSGEQPGPLTGAQTLAAGLSKLAAGANTLATGDGTAAKPGLVGLAAGLQELASSMPELVAGATGLANGTNLLAGGVNKVATGAAGVATGASGVHAGAGELAAGLGELAAGTSSLTAGATAAAAGAGQLSAGVQQSATGASQLHAGLGDLNHNSAALVSGAQELAGGLGQGLSQIPTYSASQKTSIAQVVATPVAATTSKLVSATGGSAVAGLVVAIGLWLGAFAAYLVLAALPRRALNAPAAPWLASLVGLRNGLGLALAQGVIVGVALPLFAVKPVNALAAAGVALAGAVCFAALHQGFVAVCGRRIGAIASVLVLVVQVAALGVIIPSQTAPAPLAALAPFLPFNAAARVISHFIVGGDTVAVGADLATLAAWAVLGFALATWAASRRKQTTLAHLRTQALA